MRSSLFNCFLLILLPVCSLGQANLETRKLFDGKVELTVPAEFKAMTVEVMDKKYPGQQPDVVLTDDNAEVNIVAKPHQTAFYNLRKWKFSLQGFYDSLVKKVSPGCGVAG